jgi:hypothetical protein
MPTDQVPPGLTIPGRGLGLCPGAGSGLKVHGTRPAMTIKVRAHGQFWTPKLFARCRRSKGGIGERAHAHK